MQTVWVQYLWRAKLFFSLPLKTFKFVESGTKWREVADISENETAFISRKCLYYDFLETYFKVQLKPEANANFWRSWHRKVALCSSIDVIRIIIDLATTLKHKWCQSITSYYQMQIFYFWINRYWVDYSTYLTCAQMKLYKVEKLAVSWLRLINQLIFLHE